ncbi:MAG: RecX family transcriptional regulator [Clostridia bacterium]|nr:RecX family transcriptional regulator [Clostridia bacterium]
MILDNKLMKYVLFKKRTEKEVRQKCKQLDYTEDYTDEIIEYLTEAGYINDEVYVQKYNQNVIKLKKCSVFEIKMDLMRRGVDDDLIEKYIDDSLYEYEEECAIELAQKKYRSENDMDKVKKYLINKGYTRSNVSKAIDNLANLEDN